MRFTTTAIEVRVLTHEIAEEVNNPHSNYPLFVNPVNPVYTESNMPGCYLTTNTSVFDHTIYAKPDRYRGYQTMPISPTT